MKIKKIIKPNSFHFLGQNLFKNISENQILVKNLTWLFFSIVGSMFFIFTAKILIARYLGVSDFGKFSFALGFATLFSVLTDFGLNTLTLREVSKEKKQLGRFLPYALCFKLLLGIFALFTIAMASLFLNKSFNIKIYIILFGVYTILQGLNQMFLSVYNAHEKMEYNFKIKITNGVIFFSLIVILIVLKRSMLEIICAYVLTQLILFVLNIKLLNSNFSKLSIKFNFSKMKSIFFQVWPFALGLIFTTIYVKIDIVMLSFIKGNSQTGIYSAAYNLLFALQGLIGITHQIILPRLALYFHKKQFQQYKKLLLKVMRLSSLIIIPIVIILSILSKLLMKSIYGTPFAQGYIALIVLFWNGFIIYISSFFGYSLMMTNRQKYWTLAVSIGAFINILLNFVLIYPFGYLGAAISTIVTETIVLFLAYHLNSKAIKFKLSELFFGIKESNEN